MRISDWSADGCSSDLLERVEIERMVAVGDRQADPLRRLIAAEVARGRVDPVEQHPPLDPVARVDDVETVGRGGLESDGRARRSVGHIVTLPPSLRAAKPRGNPALRKDRKSTRLNSSH